MEVNNVTAFRVSKSSRPPQCPSVWRWHTCSSDRIAADQLPIDWAGQHGLQVGIRFRLAGPAVILAKTLAFGSSIATSSHAVKCLRAPAEAAYEAHL